MYLPHYAAHDRCCAHPVRSAVLHACPAGRASGSGGPAAPEPHGGRTRLPAPDMASLTGMDDGQNLTQRRHVDLARVASAFCCRGV
ncbi:putative leader peptide [Streptomyces sp. NPDC047737]|uniref:putative leader peptide n=1 Tax=unclassified Streptomyces TaxID=2593676 RepID=UPI0033D40811